ncbi:MAG TPA: DUF4139 domain-containing protein [Allosphingosinicella sp.]|nr:DUF4139 domain-containing protein [Allosphingosinicella sp.]
MRQLVLLSALAATSAFAQPPAAILPSGQSAQGDVSVTIYSNLALVQDRRTLAIPAQRSRQEFPDVSAQIRPETVTLSGPGISIVEQNFDFDLLSPSALMQKAVGETITLVRTNPATGQETREQAKVLAVNGGTVLQIGDHIEVLRDDDLPVRVVFDRVPENLRPRPTLSVTIDSVTAGTRPLTLSYLTPGLGWKADYVALFDEAAGKIDVQGWVTLTNTTGTTFVNADTLLVAGAVGTSFNNRRNNNADDDDDDDNSGPAIRAAGTESSGRERVGDFYLYPLAERTTIANNQTKQVSFLDARGATATKAYEYRVNWLQTADEAASADTVVKFSNGRGGGLGDQLPAGTVRIYVKDARGAPQFVGEGPIPHTPMGSNIAIRTGAAFDVKVRPEVVKREKIDSDEWERTARYRISGSGSETVQVDRNVTYYRTTMAYTLTNARPAPVVVDLVQAGLDRGFHDTRALDETVPGERKSLDERLYHVTVPANGRVVVNATFETRY